MNKQVKFYNIKLNLVRTAEEKMLGDKRDALKKEMYNIKKELSEKIKKELDVERWTEECSIELKERLNKEEFNNRKYEDMEKELKQVKKDIHNLYLQNKDLDRVVLKSNIRQKEIIAIGENNLTRTMGLNLVEFTDKILTIKVGDMDSTIVDYIVKNGLSIINVNDETGEIIEDKKYKFFTAGAGQTRQKKFMMVLDDENYDNIMLQLMCGLTIEDINNKGGMNISKFLAYLSLNNSSSYIWENFNIDRCIVVDDFETMVSGRVDYITKDDKVKNGTFEVTRKLKNGGKKTYEVNKYKTDWTINKDIQMNVPIPHFDGLGIMLPSLSKKNTQFRAPWFKGLLTPFAFNDFITKEMKVEDVTVNDIYGKEYNIIGDKIEIIFSKSQFKLWKYYKDWDDYKNKFKQYNCKANICMEDEENYRDMNINYQMLQQLTNMSDEEVEILTKDTKELINDVHHLPSAQLELLGATKDNRKRDYIQEALYLYPELLTSAFFKKQVSDKITKTKKDICSGKIKIKGSRRVFLLSDPYAFCEWLFKGEETPIGLLEDGQVYCSLLKDTEKVDVLRSPSLSFEHAIRNNVASQKKIKKWFITDGCYTSSHDLISKILQFDVDGDECLILGKEADWIIKLAEEMIDKYNIKPLYYEMGKADAKIINEQEISNSLLYVFNKSNIGKVSNAITNIWNLSGMDSYDKIQKLTMYNNEVIDSAKTLSISKAPTEVKESLKIRKYPYFFQYAKDKKEGKCKKISDSTMDRICKSVESIPYTNFDYSIGFGAFRLKTLLHNQANFDIDRIIIDKYLELEKMTLGWIDDYASDLKEEDKRKTNFKQTYYEIAYDIIEQWGNENNIELNTIIDNIVKYEFKCNSVKMKFLWNVFGAEIINNLKNNIKKPLTDGYVMCLDCGTRIQNTNGKVKRCKKCANKRNISKTKINKKSKIA